MLYQNYERKSVQTQTVFASLSPAAAFERLDSIDITAVLWTWNVINERILHKRHECVNSVNTSQDLYVHECLSFQATSLHEI